MEFGIINLSGLAIVFIMMIPNIFYAFRFQSVENKCTNKVMNILEQIGRYGFFTLMFLPLGVWKFGFQSVGDLFLVYWIVWFFYFKEQSRQKELALAVIPMLFFLLSGITLRHPWLILTSIIFGVGHLYGSDQKNKDES